MIEREVIVGNIIQDDEMLIGKVADVIAYTKDTIVYNVQNENWDIVRVCLNFVDELSQIEFQDMYIKAWATPMGTYSFKTLD